MFKLVPNGDGTYTQSTLYSFAGGNAGPILDGANPSGALIMDGAGNLYGTTAGGGFGSGTVFEIPAH